MSRNQITDNKGTHYEMKCQRCGWYAEDKLGPSLARLHTKETGHPTEYTRKTRYTIKRLY